MKTITMPGPAKSKEILGLLACAFLMKFITRYLVLAVLVVSISSVAQDKPPATADQGASQTADLRENPSAAASENTGKAAEAKPAQASAESTEELTKAAQNPVASLISVPFQNNNNFGIGPYDRSQDVLYIQPVIPMALNKNWNLITRIIQPVVYQPYPNATTGGAYGFGDMVPQFYFSPRNSGKVIWGAGPQLVIPTATNDILGAGKLSLGPALVVLTQPKPWSIGVIVNNVWSVAGSGSRPPVNQMLMQPFINYNMQKGWYLTTSPYITANWRASSGNTWVVPVGGGLGRITKLGSQPVNISAQFFGNAAHPPGTSSWSMRLQFVLLYPKAAK